MATEIASTLDDIIVDPLERGFAAVGAMEGELAPLKRAAIGGLIGYAFVSVFKPGVAFDEAGKARPFALGNDDKSSDPTYFPEWMFVALPAFICGVLI
jgi:hypothetical protein